VNRHTGYLATFKMRARSVRWRSGFYEVQDCTSKAASNILGEANIATEGDETEPNK